MTGYPADGVTDLLERQLLVIGGCTREVRSRVVAGEGVWAPLMAGLGEVAAGLILCGDDGCVLLLGTRSPHAVCFLTAG